MLPLRQSNSSTSTEADFCYFTPTSFQVNGTRTFDRRDPSPTRLSSCTWSGCWDSFLSSGKSLPFYVPSFPWKFLSSFSPQDLEIQWHPWVQRFPQFSSFSATQNQRTFKSEFQYLDSLGFAHKRRSAVKTKAQFGWRPTTSKHSSWTPKALNKSHFKLSPFKKNVSFDFEV